MTDLQQHRVGRSLLSQTQGMPIGIWTPDPTTPNLNAWDAKPDKRSDYSNYLFMCTKLAEKVKAKSSKVISDAEKRMCNCMGCCDMKNDAKKGGNTDLGDYSDECPFGTEINV